MKTLSNLTSTSVSDAMPMPAMAVGAATLMQNGTKRYFRLTQSALFVFKGTTSVTIPLCELLALAVAHEPFLSAAPVIKTQPATQAVADGSNVTFIIKVDSEAVPSFQWTKNGVVIENASSPSLLLSNVQKIDQAAYACVVSSVAGQTVSGAAVLTVL